MHYVYLLISQKDAGKVYIGQTEHLEKRLDEHNQGQSGYSQIYAPWKVETYLVFSDKKQAIAFEKYLKSGSGFAFLKKHLLPK